MCCTVRVTQPRRPAFLPFLAGLRAAASAACWLATCHGFLFTGNVVEEGAAQPFATVCLRHRALHLAVALGERCLNEEVPCIVV
jgi:hypothetical protein